MTRTSCLKIIKELFLGLCFLVLGLSFQGSSLVLQPGKNLMVPQTLTDK